MLEDISRDVLKNFYSGVEYWPSKKYPTRPRELHTPLYLKRGFNGIDPSEIQDNKIVFCFDKDFCEHYAAVLLHETLFHYYKALYNYLAARNLYYGGLIHWIEITTYYAKFYLARALVTLVGLQSYAVTDEKSFFIHEIVLALKKPCLKQYRISPNVDLVNKCGKFIIDTKRINSHKDVWEAYRALNKEKIGINVISLSGEENDALNISKDYLIQQRNEENYTFDGYWHIDFNIGVEQFSNWYDSDYIKKHANTLYDMTTGEIIITFSHLYRLLKDLAVPGLPIEIEKHAHMIEYSLPDGEAKEKLLMLCKEGFPTQTLYSDDGSVFYDELDRYL
jgi:hypothetical protein